MEFEPVFVEALQRAVTPSDADVSVARGAVLAVMAGSAQPPLLTEFEDEYLAAVGIIRPPERTVYQAVVSSEPGQRFADPDPMEPHLGVFRAQHAVRRAVAQLIAEGWIVRGEGNQYPIQPERISVEYPGGGSSAPVLVHSPHIGDRSSPPRFLLVRPADGDGVETLLPVEEMLVDLDGILGMRGMQLVRESRRALGRGLFLASSSLLAAASESAWFTLARGIKGPGDKLRALIDNGRDVGEVIRLTEQHLKSARAGRSSTIAEVVSQGHLFREIRNYALHPVEEHDADREMCLTGTGATLLAISARRYLLKLSDLRLALGRLEDAE